MALSLNTVWEVRTAGNDANGGGFVAGATGTDMSIFDNKNSSGGTSCQSTTANLSTTDGVANGTSTYTSATAAFSSAIVGNIIYLIGGSGALPAQRRQVASFTNSTTIVLDQAVSSSTGMTLNIGGACATLTQPLLVMAAGNKIFIKAGTYQTAAGYTGTTNVAPLRTQPYSRIIGYTATRGDNGKATIQLITNTGLTAISCNSVNGWSIENLIIDCNSLGTSIGITIFNSSMVRNSKVMNFTSKGINLAGSTANSFVENCEITAGTAAATGATQGNGSVFGCWVHDNACPGIVQTTVGLAVAFNIVSNNSGASSDGIQISSLTSHVYNNTVYASGRDGIRNTSATSSEQAAIIRNNVLANNGGFGLNLSAGGGGTPADRNYDGNVYFSNTSGTRNNCDDTSTNPVNGVGAWTNTLDVVLSGASPFIAAGSNDFRLNNVLLAGASCRGAGVIPFPGSSSMLTAMDMGVSQSKPMLIDSGMDGGF